jgi:hypothetical protein
VNKRIPVDIANVTGWAGTYKANRNYISSHIVAISVLSSTESGPVDEHPGFVRRTFDSLTALRDEPLRKLERWDTRHWRVRVFIHRRRRAELD